MRYITFFINLFGTVCERLILLRQEGRIGEDLAKDWKTYLSAMPQRTELYNTVVARKTIVSTSPVSTVQLTQFTIQGRDQTARF